MLEKTVEELEQGSSNSSKEGIISSDILTPKSGSQSQGSNQKQGSSTGSSLSHKSAREVTLNYSLSENDLSRMSEALASVQPNVLH